LKKSIDFSKYTSIKIGPIVEVEMIHSAEELKTDSIIIGGGNNMLIPDHIKNIKILSKAFDFIEIKENFLHIGGATVSGKIASFAKKNNIAHFEHLYRLPGTMGGMIKMNAGLKKWETFNYLEAVKINNQWIKKEDIDYAYRETKIQGIIYEAKFKIEYGYDKEAVKMFLEMRDNQPQLPSAGSCFINPKNDYAGRLIEAVGLKGYSINGMSFSEKHANFLVNNGKGTYNDALALIRKAQQKVKEKFDIDLKTEIIIL